MVSMVSKDTSSAVQVYEPSQCILLLISMNQCNREDKWFWQRDPTEYVDHLPVNCEFDKRIWMAIGFWCKQSIESFSSVKDDLAPSVSSRVSRSHLKILSAAASTTCWFIWKGRNDKAFNSKTPFKTKVIEDIKADSFV